MENFLITQLKYLDPSNINNNTNNNTNNNISKFKNKKILWDVLLISLISYNIIAYYSYNNYNKKIGLFFIVVSIFSALADSNLVNSYIIDYIDRILGSISFILCLFFIIYNFNIKIMFLPILIIYLAIYSINKARCCDNLEDWRFYQNIWHIIPAFYVILLTAFNIKIKKL